MYVVKRMVSRGCREVSLLFLEDQKSSSQDLWAEPAEAHTRQLRLHEQNVFNQIQINLTLTSRFLHGR